MMQTKTFAPEKKRRRRRAERITADVLIIAGKIDRAADAERQQANALFRSTDRAGYEASYHRARWLAQITEELEEAVRIRCN